MKTDQWFLYVYRFLNGVFGGVILSFERARSWMRQTEG